MGVAPHFLHPSRQSRASPWPTSTRIHEDAKQGPTPRNKRKHMTAAYAVFALAVAIAAAFVLTVRVWIRHEEEVLRHG